MKTVLVTGISGNLGAAVSDRFITEGWRVAGTGHVEDSKTNLVVSDVDLSDEAAASKYVSSVIGEFETISVAVLTVGGFAMGKFVDTSFAEMEKQFRLNFATAYNVARPVFAHMLKQGSGRIFMIGSKPGSDMHKSKGMIAYGLSKSLIFQLAELMNDESKGFDIVTSVIVPSTIDTPQNRQAMPDADHKKWVTADSIADIIHTYSSEGMSMLREPVIKIYNNA